MSFKISKSEAEDMAGFLLEEILETFDFHCVEIFSGDTDREIFIESLESLIARKIIEYVS